MAGFGVMRTLCLSGAIVAATALAAHAQREDVIVGLGLEPPHLDPTAGAAAAIDEVVYANLFEGLTRIDETGAVQPALAESWDISDDGLTYVFRLRQGVTFHDGTSFDAEDVVFSLDRARAEDSVNAQKVLFDAIESVEAPGPHEVRVTLSVPQAQFPWNMGWGDAVIVAPESADGNGNNPIGTGPFRFERWVSGDRVVLQRYDGYWGDQPALAEITFQVIPDAAAQVQALLAGDIDAFPNMGAPETLAQFESDPAFTVAIGTTEGETILAINHARPPFDDLRVRRALAHAINRQDIVDGAMFGYGTPIGSHFAPHHPAYVDLTGLYPYDPETARALLAEAGHADGLTVRLILPPPSYARRGGEIIASQLAQVGITAEIEPVEWAQWLDAVFTNTNYDLTIVSHTEPLDIGIYARETYYFNYDGHEMRALLDELANTPDVDAQYALYGVAQQVIADDAVNVFLFQLAKLGVWDSQLTGMWVNSPIQANDMTGVAWAE
ncbi:MAG: ABC transporter substrate-binding protein [Alphaproteobacteria bacterium]